MKKYKKNGKNGKNKKGKEKVLFYVNELKYNKN